MTSSRVRQIGFSPTLAISDEARRLREAGVDVLDFGAGEPDFPTPEPVKAAGRRAIDENRTGYTANAGIGELRAAIAARAERERGGRYRPEDVLVSAGAKFSLYLAFQALLDPGDEAIVPVPYWTSYPEQLRLSGATPVFIDCPARERFRLDVDRLEAVASARTKLLVLDTPSNPTGACYGAHELAPIAEWCLARGVWVVADEIYSKLVYDGAGFSSIAGLGEAIRARTVVIDGVSKAYSMTGWRIGWALGPGEVIAAMAKLQSQTTSNATSIAQWASLTAVGLDDAAIAPRVAEFSRRRDTMLAGLAAIPGWSCAAPEGAFYLFPCVAGSLGATLGGRTLKSGGDLARYLLTEAHVAVVGGEAFGAPEHVRLSYAVSEERIREGTARIERAVRALGARAR